MQKRSNKCFACILMMSLFFVSGCCDLANGQEPQEIRASAVNDPVEGPIFDNVAKRIEKRINESNATAITERKTILSKLRAMDSERQGLRAEIAKSRAERKTARSELLDARREMQANREAEKADLKAEKDEREGFLKRLRDWTPGKNIIERGQAFVIALLVLAGLIAVLGFVILIIVAMLFRSFAKIRKQLGV